MKKITSAVADLLRAVAGRPKKHEFTSAVIVAGGSGTRFSTGGQPGGADREKSETKQLTPLCGIPVVVHTLLAFEHCPDIDEIIVVAREDELPLYDGLRRQYGITKLRAALPGGATRQESALAGFRRISPDARFVAIHDAARCCVTPEMISAVAAEAAVHGAAAAGHRATDTVKREQDGFIRETLDRDLIWLVSTPQIFAVEIYRACVFAAARDSLTVTDDCGLLEAQGFRVRLCDVGSENIKITVPEDLMIAEKIFESRKERETS